MGIDGVKVVVVTREDRGKRLAIVARRRRGNLRAELDQAWVVAGNRQNDASAIEDSVVGAPDGREIVGRNRRYRGNAVGRDDARQIELELRQLVKGGLDRPGHDLDAASQASRRRDQQSD